jgi:hypothetical protein
MRQMRTFALTALMHKHTIGRPHAGLTKMLSDLKTV